MKALIQSYQSGVIEIADLPAPNLQPEGLLVQNAVSLVSAGTEKSMVELAQKNLLGKARERPDLVRQVIQKVKRDGIEATVKTVRSRLDTPIPLGYSSAGTVIAIGKDVTSIQVGDRVACAGAGYASHAEVVYIPENLCVSIPADVDFESAAFVTLGAIALQGIRLAELRLGEVVAVIGLGLLGQLTVQLLKASGCIVIGMDLQKSRADLAQQLGADAVATDASTFAEIIGKVSGGHGVDAVLITAATKSDEPIALAGEIARVQGTIVAVGAIGMNIPRKPYYDKELVFRVSRSYGPGRYDPNYEEKGYDYPIGYVRWTENRNMQAFIQQIADKRVDVKSLITHRYDIKDALAAYQMITDSGHDPYLGITLNYPEQVSLSQNIAIIPPDKTTNAEATIQVGVLGAGSFATGTLLPIMKQNAYTKLISVCTATGLSAHHVAKKFNFSYASTDETSIIEREDINTVVIATRHHLHSRQIMMALQAGKHVFCEKPLCINQEELTEIVNTYDHLESPPILMVGYNRRFAPMAQQMKSYISHIQEPLMLHYRVNAGFIPLNHWVHDPEQGGGRIIGEVCHFIDFLTFLTGSIPVEIYAKSLPNLGQYSHDNVAITMNFQDGSIGTITYVANGDKSFSKEYVEVFGGGAVAVLDNFRKLQLTKNGKQEVHKSRFAQDKGHQAEWEAFCQSIKNAEPPPITFSEIRTTALATFKILESLQTNLPQKIEY